MQAWYSKMLPYYREVDKVLSNYNNFKTRCSVLTINQQRTTDINQALEIERDNLRRELNDLQDRYGELKPEIQRLVDLSNELTTAYDSLKTEHITMFEQLGIQKEISYNYSKIVEGLTGDIKRLTSERDSLREKLDSLINNSNTK